MIDGVRAMLMRGGTSKGLYFLPDDLPNDEGERDSLLLRIMGSPDARQIDGIGGAHPLTSKVGIISPSERDDADVDYLFLQLGVDNNLVTDKQNCGNILAGVGPFAIERGLVGGDGATGDGAIAEVRINQRNTGGIATAKFPIEGGRPRYQGDTAISGVPGSAAAVQLFFEGTAGSTCGSLLPTGNPVDVFELTGRQVRVTCIDNGMPTVVVAATDMNVTGDEAPAALEADQRLRADLETLRLAAGEAMGLGDVSELTIPKMTMVSPALHGGAISTRTFIPHRCHEAIGVLGAVSVASACLLEDSPGFALATITDPTAAISLEHPTGHFDCVFEFDDDGAIARAGVVRTARKLFDGTVFPREDL